MRLTAQLNFDVPGAAGQGRFRAAGTVLLEVVLALVLFAVAAAIIGGGLHAALQSVDRLRLGAHAANLAVSVLSELQMGTKSPGLQGAQPFEAPFEEWTWEVQVLPGAELLAEPGGLETVEVIIRHAEPAVVYRLSQTLRLEHGPVGGEETPSLKGTPF